VGTPARDLLMHTAMEQKHIPVRVEMPQEGTLTVVLPLAPGPVKRRFILVFFRGGNMTRIILVLVNIPKVKRSTTTTIKLSKSGLVCFLDIIQRHCVRTSYTGNGGDGGYAGSGDAYAYGYGASAQTGPGGNASGGSVNGGRYDKARKRGIRSLYERRSKC
jgi:hypothetical protein